MKQRSPLTLFEKANPAPVFVVGLARQLAGEFNAAALEILVQ